MQSFPRKQSLAYSIVGIPILGFAFAVFSFLTQPSEVLADPALSHAGLLPDSSLITTDLPLQVEPEVIFPSPTCRADLTQFDAGVGQLEMLGDLQSLGTVLQKTSSSGDRLLRTYIRERLIEVIGADPNSALAIIESAETAQGAESVEYLEALRNAAAARGPEVAERLLTMAEKDTDLQRRVFALKALQSQLSLTESQLDRLATLGKDKSAQQLAQASVATIGRVMKKDSERFEPYVQRLLDIAESQVDEGLTTYALEMSGAYTDPPFGEVSRRRLASLILHHPSAPVRVMAASVISTARDTEEVLKVYQQAFQESNDLCVRWNMLKFSLRAAGAGALPLVEAWAKQDARFLQDYSDFKALYDSGIVDWGRIWLGKTANGFHQCDLAP